jgi:hypothetical protein
MLLFSVYKEVVAGNAELVELVQNPVGFGKALRFYA